MPNTTPRLADLSDRDLVATVAHLAAGERHATADLMAALAELDARKLYLEDGCASLFTFCTQRLRLSESAAYHRITAARAARRFPAILEHLREGTLTLTTVCLLAPHLTDEDHLVVLDAARDLGKRAVEELVARLQPRPDIVSSVRKLPSPPASAADGSEARRVNGAAGRPPGSFLASAVLDQADDRSNASPASPPTAGAAADRVNTKVDVAAKTAAEPRTDPPARSRQPILTAPASAPAPRRAADTPEANTNRSLSRSSTPGRHPQARARTIPAAVRRAVWARDGGRCTYVGASGRCTERSFLEFHHRIPFAAGGESTVENVAVLCRAHNAHLAEQEFPPAASGGS